jgi:GPH family glycoside/pentoside/hexuronide:cation symporter
MTKLSKKIRIYYALGQLGWSILASIIGTWLIYFYLPPESSGMDIVVPQGGIFLGITLIGVITAFATSIDAITDPWIANKSDKSTHPLGRRIPFMRKSAFPFAMLLVLVFVVPFQGEIHILNSLWLLVIFTLYIVAYTSYVVPYTALLSELGASSEERIDLSTYISVTWFLGLVIATFAPSIWDLLLQLFDISKTLAMQITFGMLGIVALIFMLIPAYGIDEKKYCTATATSLDMKSSIKSVFANADFRYFLLSELGYWLSNGFFQATLVYYITVLALQKESSVGLIVTAVGILSFLMYPAVNKLSKKYGKKKLMIVSFFFLIVSFVYISFLGKLPFSGIVQLIPVIIFFAIPSAISGILPNAIIADCAVYDAYETGENKEALYFGVRSFLSKVGIALATLILPSVLAMGKSVENDKGIRISVLIAAGVALFSLVVFLKYDEKRISEKIEETKIS